jgi:hypothetical protein
LVFLLGVLIAFTFLGICSSTNETSCRGGQCISKSLKCDGYNQCGDNSDECTLHVTGSVIGRIVGGVIGLLVIAGIIGAVCYFRRRRNRGSVLKVFN